MSLLWGAPNPYHKVGLNTGTKVACITQPSGREDLMKHESFNESAEMYLKTVSELAAPDTLAPHFVTHVYVCPLPEESA